MAIGATKVLNSIQIVKLQRMLTKQTTFWKMATEVSAISRDVSEYRDVFEVDTYISIYLLDFLSLSTVFDVDRMPSS